MTKSILMAGALLLLLFAALASLEFAAARLAPVSVAPAFEGTVTPRPRPQKWKCVPMPKYCTRSL